MPPAPGSFEPAFSSSSSAPQVSTLEDALGQLQQMAQAGGQVDIVAVRPLVEQSLSLAQGANLQVLADLADAFVRLRLRLALRDLLPIVAAQLHGDGAQLAVVARLLSAYGRGALYFSELFEFCDSRLASMQAADLGTYVYETGRHGLRCRHFADTTVNRAIELLPQMPLGSVMQVWQGYIRFSRDRRAFYQAALPRLQAQIRDLSIPQLLLALRAARDLRHIDGFVVLHAACSTELMLKMNDVSLEQSAACLMQAAYSPRYRAQAQGLVRSVEQKWSRTEDLSSLRVVEVVDALETFASWRMQPMGLLNRLDTLLCDRRQELQYSGNVTLWVSATQAFSRLDLFGAQWPRVALELARDKHFVERCSFFQQCHLVTSLGRLRLLDEQAYTNIAELLVSDIRLFKEIQDMAPVLWSFATVGYFHKGLFDACYDLVIEWLEAESLDPTKRPVHGSLCQVAWSLTLAGYHKQYDSFAALLDYVVFGESGEGKAPQTRRLAQMVDVVATEAPGCVQNCQYPDKLEAMRAGPEARRVVEKDPPGDGPLLEEVKAAVAAMGWAHQTMTMPSSTAAFYVDISLEQQLGQKLGILTAGTFEQIRMGLPGQPQTWREAGLFQLHRSLLSQHGWRTIVVDRESWDQLPGLDARKAYLEKACQEALAR